MRCVLVFCLRKREWWREQRYLRDLSADGDTTLAEGLHAYAAEQATLEQRIHQEWSELWRATRRVAQPIIDGDAEWELETEGEKQTVEVWGDDEPDAVNPMDW